MQRKKYRFILIWAGFIFFVACATGLDQYKARSLDEEAVINVVMEHERTWNEHDTAGFLATFHNDARIELMCDGPLLSKNEFATHISQLMSDYPSVKLVNPSIDISGEKAEVKVTSTEMGNRNHIFEIAILKQNHQWYIIRETCY